MHERAMTPVPLRCRPSALLAAALACVLLLAGACSGDDPEAGPAGSETPTTAATEDYARATSPQSLDAYRYTVAVTMSPDALDTSEAPSGLPLEDDIVIALEGERVNPNREHSRTAIDVGFLQVEMETIWVGEQQWTRSSAGQWEDGPSAASGLLGNSDFRPSSIFSGDEGEYAAVAERMEEHPWEEAEVDGEPARHFTFTEAEFLAVFEAQSSVVPEDVEAELSAELWISQQHGVPVRMLITGTDPDGAEVLRLEMQLTDLNGEISVEPPTT